MDRFDPTLTPAAPAGGYAGIQRIIEVPAPAAGAPWQVKVDAGVYWRPICGLITLVTSAAVANRSIGIQLSDGNNPFWRGAVATAVTGGATVRIGIGGGVVPYASFAAPATGTIPLPDDVVLPGGYIIGSADAAFDVADQYGVIRLLVQQLEEYPSGPPWGPLDRYQFEHGEHRHHHA